VSEQGDANRPPVSKAGNHQPAGAGGPSGPQPVSGQGRCPVEPPKRNPENRTAALRIRLKAGEREVIGAAAARLGVGICTYSRMATLRAAGLADTLQKRRKPSDAQRLVAESLGQLARIGGNINQAVHNLNAGWDCDPEILRAATAELRALREAILAATADDRRE
jgi:hypothetical protein